MSHSSEVPSVGVEEEYQLVDPESWELIPNCREVMGSVASDPWAEIHHELHLNQIEMATDVCQTLDQVRDRLCRIRGILVDAAEKSGSRLVAAGTHPMRLPKGGSMTPTERYRMMIRRFQHLARELFIFGCHVHVAMKDSALGLPVMNRARRWLPLLQALTANSPFWDGQDTGYGSYRRELWAQWPLAGPPPHFDTVQEYHTCIEDLTRCAAIKQQGDIHWDIRLPTKVPTIEFRVADVMTRVEETVGYVGLVRALVMTCLDDVRADRPQPHIRGGIVSYALWHAARYGINDHLIDPQTCERVEARKLVDGLVDRCEAAARRSGDEDIIRDYVEKIFANGTGADRQRRCAGDNIDLKCVVQTTAGETAGRFGAGPLSPGPVSQSPP